VTEDIATLEAALVARREPYARVTVVWSRAPTSARAGDTALVTGDGRLHGWVGGSCSEPVVLRESLVALTEGTPRLLWLAAPDDSAPAPRDGVVVAPVTCASGGTVEVFVEPRLPLAHLVAVGRSPLVEALAAIASSVGFDVCVVERDDVDAARFGAARVVPELDLGKAGVGADSFVVVATMGRYDEDALEAALRTDARYVGLVASARRAAAVRELLAAGGVSEADLDRVRAPVGLDLGSIPHREIAVAVLAELVAEKAKHRVPPPAQAPAVMQAETEAFVDPVCGMTVDASPADAVEHDGRRYAFCCSGCRRSFLADPARYLGAA
jgi:xanthine dehydrogenase accessory factor